MSTDMTTEKFVAGQEYIDSLPEDDRVHYLAATAKTPLWCRCGTDKTPIPCVGGCGYLCQLLPSKDFPSKYQADHYRLMARAAIEAMYEGIER